MQKLIIGSQNPVKIEALKQAFVHTFPTDAFSVISILAKSGVPDQPFSDDETKLGAYNRCMDCKKKYPTANYWANIEGGCMKYPDRVDAFAWVVIMSNSQIGISRTATFVLPKIVTDGMKEGLELGDVTDRIFHKHNSKQKGGTVGLLTRDIITRSVYYEHACYLALIPFTNKELYSSE